MFSSRSLLLTRPAPPAGAVAYDSSALYTTSGGTITSPWANNFNHASIGGTAATNLGIVVAMGNNGGSQTFEPSGTPTCTFGGVSLTYRTPHVVMGGVIQAGWIACWAGLGIPTGTQNVAFSVSSATSAFTQGYVASFVYTGVGSFGSLVTNAANSAAASLTIASAVGRKVFALFSQWQPSAFSSPSFTSRRSASAVAPAFIAGDQNGAASTSVTATLSSMHWAGLGFEMLAA